MIACHFIFNSNGIYRNGGTYLNLGTPMGVLEAQPPRSQGMFSLLIPYIQINSDNFVKYDYVEEITLLNDIITVTKS